jgi:hypothetical protein
MIDRLYIAIASAVLFLQLANPSFAQQVPYGTNQPNIPISSHDRVYHADQSSNGLPAGTSRAGGSGCALCRQLHQSLAHFSLG